MIVRNSTTHCLRREIDSAREQSATNIRPERAKEGKGVLTVGVNTAWKAKTSQPKATPWEQSATNIRPEWAKELLFHALTLPLCSGGLLFFCPLRGRIPAASSPPGRCPGLAYQCPIRGVNLPQIYIRRAMPWTDVLLPLRGVGSLTFMRICYPPESNIRILNPPCPAAQPPRKRGVGAHPWPSQREGGKATVRS